MNPTKSSSPKNGIGTINGAKYEIISIKTLPAKMLPKSRKVREMIRENSPIISKNQQKILSDF